MSAVSINKLRSEVGDREQRKIKIFDKVLDLCYSKILNNNKTSDDYSCTYIVPNVVFGLPLYNVNDCTKYIMDKLVEKGFEVFFALPTTLHISWKPEDHNKSYNNYNQNMLTYYNLEQNPNHLAIQYKGNSNNNKHSFNQNNNFKQNEKINNKINKVNKDNQISKLRDTMPINNKQYRSIDDYNQSALTTIYDNADEIDIYRTKIDNLFL